jgi:hypothetical protein
VKKAWSRAPAVAATQNMLMRKLGLASSAHVETDTDNFNRYLQLFNQRLSEDQAWRIEDLFMAGVVAIEPPSEVVDGEAV